jgi:thiamine kinase-like enzyme
VPHIEQFRSLGLPYQNLGDFTTSLGQLLSRLVAMQKWAPGELKARELDTVSIMIGKARQDCETLAACNIPETLVHGDLNESNIFRTLAGTTSLIDWTFSRIGHPFFSLGFSLFAASQKEHRMNARWTELRNAYAEPWRAYAEESSLFAGIDAASRLFWIDVAQVFERLILKIRPELPGAVAHLSAVLRLSLSAFGLGDGA